MSSPLSRVVVAAPFVLTCALSFVLHAQTSSAQKPAQEKPAVKSAPMRTIVSVEGKDNFEAYCAVCHGKDAKGTGPAAPAMKTPVPDLTLIAKRHGGKFDPIEIENTIRGTDKRLATPAHGVETMPVWGDAFRGTEDPAVTTMRVTNLVTDLKSIQVK